MQSPYTSNWSSKLQTLYLSKTCNFLCLELTPDRIPYSILGKAECEATQGNYTFTVCHYVYEIVSFVPGI